MPKLLTKPKTAATKKDVVKDGSARRYRQGSTRANGEVVQRVRGSSARVLAGQENLDEWDDEEIERGYRRNKNGGWTGRPPVIIPTEIHHEAIRRKLKQATHLLQRDGVLAAITTLMAICESPLSDDRARVSAAKVLLDRAYGPVTLKMEHSMKEEAPWMKAIAGALVAITPGGSDSADDFIDVESEEITD